MMIIWIVDDDVGFAYGFKNRLKNPGRKIEVFTDIDSFLKKTKKIKKEKLPLPDIVFIDINLPNRSGTDLYLEFLNQNDPLTGRFYFCSALSYGRFEKFFELRNLKPPPFVQKNRLEHEGEKIVEACQPKDKKKETPELTHPLVRRKIGELGELQKQLGDLYYKGVFEAVEIAVFIPLVEKIGALATSLSIPQVAEATLALTAVLVKPGIGVMRVKREGRDFMSMMEKWKR